MGVFVSDCVMGDDKFRIQNWMKKKKKKRKKKKKKDVKMPDWLWKERVREWASECVSERAWRIYVYTNAL